MVTLGATVSTLIPPTVTIPLLPALSTAVPVALLAPWAASVASGWQLAMPLTASLQSNCTVTGALYQPRSEEHTSELQSRQYFVCRLLLDKKHIHINMGA